MNLISNFLTLEHLASAAFGFFTALSPKFVAWVAKIRALLKADAAKVKAELTKL